MFARIHAEKRTDHTGTADLLTLVEGRTVVEFALPKPEDAFTAIVRFSRQYHDMGEPPRKRST